MRSVSSLMLALIMGCAAVVSGCGCSDEGKASSPKWLVFEGDGIRLELPESFKGGDPSDPLVLAMLEEVVASNPEPDRREGYESLLTQIRDDLETAGGSIDKLLAFGEPDAEGWMPTVQVWPLSKPLGASMEAFVRDWCSVRGDATIEVLTEYRAYVVCRVQGYAPEDPQKWTIQDVVFVDSPLEDSLQPGRIVFYTYDSPANIALDQVFRDSAATIRLGY